MRKIKEPYLWPEHKSQTGYTSFTKKGTFLTTTGVIEPLAPLESSHLCRDKQGNMQQKDGPDQQRTSISVRGLMTCNTEKRKLMNGKGSRLKKKERREKKTLILIAGLPSSVCVEFSRRTGGHYCRKHRKQMAVRDYLCMRNDCDCQEDNTTRGSGKRQLKGAITAKGSSL